MAGSRSSSSTNEKAVTRNCKPRRSPEVIAREPESPSIPAAQPSSRLHADAPTAVAAGAKVDADLPKGETAPARQISKRARRRQLAERERQLEERQKQMALEVTAPVAGPSTAAASPAPSGGSITVASPPQEVRTEAISQDHKPVIEREPEVSNVSSTGSPPKHESEIGDPALKIKAGLQTADYQPLASLKPNNQMSVIGVVTSARDVTRSRNGDWKQTLTLLAPSNLERYGGYLYRASAEGDVILLRMVKSVNWNSSVMLKGYYDRMRWCIFDPSTGQPKPPALDNAPHSEGLDNGAGVTFSPFWDMFELEVAHCAALAKWWQAVQDERVRTRGEEIQVGGGDVGNAGLSADGRPRRQHRLIADIVLYMEPDGYFDCTVEQRPYILHVTDFTANSALYQVEASWCPPNLATKALKFELWDGAAVLGPTMKPGEYWSLRNARMITSKNGYAQAKFKEAGKAKKLEEDDAEYNHHLKALLDHKLLSEAKSAELFCWTVEVNYFKCPYIGSHAHANTFSQVLHSKYEQGGMSEIYVTDYTARDDLTSPPVEDWSRELAGRIFKVELRDGHNEMAKQMPAGSFFTIKNLKLQTKGDHPKLIGHLGGHDRLLDKLNSNSDSEKLAALLKRKAQWKRGIDGAGSAQSHPRASTASAGGSRKGYSSICQIEANEKCPGRFRLRARIFDFAPALKECSKAICTKCDEMISKKHVACVKCNDMLKEHVCHCYHLFFRLEDEDGDKFVVGVDENWSDLAGLGPSNFEADNEALDVLRERLLKYIGNIECVHRGLEREVHTAFHDFTIISWPDASSHEKRDYSKHEYYVLEHDTRGGASLAEAAQTLGVQVVGRAGELKDTWLVRAARPDPSIRKRTADPVRDTLEALRRQTASPYFIRSSDARHSLRVASSVRYLERQELRQRAKRAPPPIRPGSEDTPSSVVAERLGIEDPLFSKQWHLINNEFPEHMMNVTGLWEMGITGKGVISALVDDGLDYTSDDLAANFYAEGSYDYNDHEDLPTPKLSDDHHGTRCAGQIGAVKNNVCGMGIAYESKIAGIRILSGPISDVDEAAALNYDYQNTSIFSCSWGPPDNGKAMEGPGYIIRRAMLNGIQNGREGKGSVFVFASGNGAASGDQCNFDGYTNSIYSVTVAAVDYKGLHPYYSEACAANMVVAYSSGSGQNIVTTDVGKNNCASSHGGTSAAAPNAVGVYALALSVRPDLTWRDIQHLSVRTARLINPDDPDWEPTAVGRRFSYKYGYGALDGFAFVTAAQDWQLVKPQSWVELPAVQLNNGTYDLEGNMTGGTLIVPGGVQSTITVTQQDLQENNFEKLEHITVRVWIQHTKRGDVEVEVVSPNGVKSVLAGVRNLDTDNSGYPGWKFMSVKHWDEDPLGDWTIRVSDQGAGGHNGTFLGWSLSLWGSVIDPAQVKEYVISQYEKVLPSVLEGTPTDGEPSSSSKAHPKPTEHLPGDHGDAEGEADKPTFGGGDKGSGDQDDAAAPSPSPSLTPTPDQSWFAGMGNLVSDQKWVF
ncbi:hypothetical protein EWM64_g1044, partial [Hericium alpestre]